MKLIARPESENKSNKFLEEHLREVGDSCYKITRGYNLDFNIISEEKLEEFNKILGYSHDFGKATFSFQSRFKENINNEDESLGERHSRISALLTYRLLDEKNYSDELKSIGLYIVDRHHSNLEKSINDIKEDIIKPSNRSFISKQAEQILEKTEEEIKKIYENLGIDKNIIKKFLIELSNNENDIYKSIIKSVKNMNKNKEFHCLTFFSFSILIDSDRTNSSGIPYNDWPSVGVREKIPTKMVEKYKEENISQTTDLDMKREKAYKNVNSNISSNRKLNSITLPTGSGKTLTGINAALRLSNNQKGRLVYALPFLSIIEQNHEIIKNILENTGKKPNPNILLRHDHKSKGYLVKEEKEFDTSKSVLLNNAWNSEFIITTFVQFINTIISNKNSEIQRFHKLANSTIILDEIQSIPIRYWGIFSEIINLICQKMNMKIILMTATNPMIVEDTNELVEEVEEYYSSFNRVKYKKKTDINYIKELQYDFLNRIEGTEKDCMMVMNTINSALEAYKTLSDKVDRETLFISSNFIHKHRKEKIKKIKNSEEPLLVISTQVVEAGVDIDLDIVYRDLSPMDSIVQAAGRCNRENQGKKGEVIIINLKDKDNQNRSFSAYVYDSKLLQYTKDVLNFKEIEEKDIHHILEKYYKKLRNNKNKDTNSLIEKIQKMEYKKFNVNLIEDSETIQVYIKEYDKNNTYQKVKNIFKNKNLDIEEKYNKLEQLKTNLYNNTVSIRVKNNEKNILELNESQYLDGFYILDKNMEGYSKELGLQPDKINANIFL